MKKLAIKNNPYHPGSSLNSHFHLSFPVVKPGEPLPGNCEATGPGISHAVAGEKAPFTVITKDSNGIQIPRGGANIISLFKDPKGDVTVTVNDNNDGCVSSIHLPS